MAAARIDPKVVADNEPGTNMAQRTAVTAAPAMRYRRIERLLNMRGQLSKHCAQNLDHEPDDERQRGTQEYERDRDRQQQQQNGVVHEVTTLPMRYHTCHVA
jgi:hypothetical protein